MIDAYLGEVMLFAGNFAPEGWAMCNGQLLAVDQYHALFSLLGTTYGGDGVRTFGLPDLRGRAPIHFGEGPGLGSYTLGEKVGAEAVTLTTSQLPAHDHGLQASNGSGDSAEPAGHYLSQGPSRYAATEPTAKLGDKTITPTGEGAAHDNRGPRLALNYCIAITGIFPTRS